MDILTAGCGLLVLWAAAPALDAFLRWRRLAAFREVATRGQAPKRLLVLVPSRGEGARVGDLAADVRREAAAAGADVEIRVLLDGLDAEAQARLERDGVPFLSKDPPGPSKGHALAFAGEHLRPDVEASDFILVFDADMRLPNGFFRDLRVPEAAAAFQLPVRPSGAPAPGAPRVEALSLAEARLDDLARDQADLPVRLRGKAMGFTPQAFWLGPAAATCTTAEDSEATLALLAKGIEVRALPQPIAFDEPPSDAGAMGRSRARWFGGHLKLLASGFGDLVQCALRRPVGTFVLAADLWLRPRVFLLGTLALLASASDVLLLVFSSNGAWTGLAAGEGGAAAGTARPVALLVCLLLLSLEGKSALVFEWLSLVALRARIGYPAECPPVSSSDLSDSFVMWAGATVRGVLSPTRWHRARPGA